MSRSYRNGCSCWMCRECRRNQPRDKADALAEQEMEDEAFDYDLRRYDKWAKESPCPTEQVDSSEDPTANGSSS